MKYKARVTEGTVPVPHYPPALIIMMMYSLFRSFRILGEHKVA